MGRLNVLLSKTPFFLLFVGVLTCLLQPYKTGFEKGHHGWVSSHTLAIISRAIPENNFLGYTRDVVTSSGPDELYFDRYPVIFSGTFNILLSPFWDDLDSYIYAGHQLMNLIYLLIAWLIYRVLRKLCTNEIAVPTSLFVISSGFLVKYKDMIHFDQPALVGCLLVMNGIVDYEKEGRTRFLYWGALLGPLLGRGYAVIIFLACWFAISYLKEFRIQRKLFSGVLRIPLFMFLISIPLPSLMLGMNIFSEAKIRKVSLEETSIVMSAKHRFGVEKFKDKSGQEKPFKWGSFLNNQFQRALDLSTPFMIYGIHFSNYKQKLQHYSTLIPKLIFQLLLLFLLIRFGKTFWTNLLLTEKTIYLTFILGGVMWILLMRNLANYHDYVSLYLIGFLLVLGIFLMQRLSIWKPELLKVMPALFIASILLNLGREQILAGDINWQSTEFQRVRTIMKENKLKVAYIGEDFYSFFQGVPHCADFMLSGFSLTTEKKLSDISLRKEEDKVLKVEFNSYSK